MRPPLAGTNPGKVTTVLGTDTIAALSTPPGESGIAVVRMVGPEALSILTLILKNPSPALVDNEWEHRRIYHGHLVDRDGEVVDEVMCAVMCAPNSYTGEDTVEVSCHGSSIVVTRALDVLFNAGARPAEAGEFTRRAFLNGKIDLIQAEAVADLIHARSELARKVAQRQLAGSVSERIAILADEILRLLGEVEANIDFIEEGIETLDVPAAEAMITRQQAEVARFLESASMSRPLREGYRVVFAGAVNAGKSSLFNRIVGEHRAIVTTIPGTTRDILRESVVLDGLIYTFEDTAGIRGETGDEIETIGMGKATDAVRSADVVLFVFDHTETTAPSVASAFPDLDPGRCVFVANKSDLPIADGVATISGIPEGAPVVSVSARTGDGISELTRVLAEKVGARRVSQMAMDSVILNSRLAGLMREAAERLDVLSEGLQEGRPFELLAVDAREVLARYEEAVGRRFRDDLLDVIFSRFCIGK